MHCFDPNKNEWKQKESTCQSHLVSSLLVVNNRLYVVGGKVSRLLIFTYLVTPAPVEVYNEQNNTWPVVEQNDIPPNQLGAVEIERKVYFLIKKYPF